MSEKMCVIHSEKCVNVVRADCQVKDRRTGEVSLSQIDFEMWGARFSENDFKKGRVCGSEIDNLERAAWYKYMIGRTVNKYGFDLLEIVRLDFARNHFPYAFWVR